MRAQEKNEKKRKYFLDDRPTGDSNRSTAQSGHLEFPGESAGLLQQALASVVYSYFGDTTPVQNAYSRKPAFSPNDVEYNLLYILLLQQQPTSRSIGLFFNTIVSTHRNFSFVALVSYKSLLGICQQEKPQRFEPRVPRLSDASRLTFGAPPFASLALGCNPSNLEFSSPPFL